MAGGIVGSPVQLRITAPGNAVIAHAESVLSISCQIDSPGTENGVVEDGVGNQAARVVCFAVWGESEGIAGAAIDAAIASSGTSELVGVERLDISSVVLIEAGEAVVEIDMGADVVGDAELERADGGVFNADGAIWRTDRL